MVKQRRNLLLGVASILLASSCLYSCGNSSSSEGDNSSSTTASKKIEVLFWHTFGQKIQNELDIQIENFEKLVKKNENVDVDVIASNQAGDYNTLLNKILKGYSVGNTPTMAVAYPDHVSEFLMYDDFAVNLDKFINDEKYTFGTDSYYGDSIAGTDDFVKSFYDEGSNYIVDGTYSMPFLKSTELMFYNKNVVDLIAAKYKQPGQSITDFMNTLSWSTFEIMLKDVRDVIDSQTGEYGSNLSTPAVYDSDANLFISQSYQRDIEYLGYDKANKKGKVLFNNDNSKAMVSALKKNYDDRLFYTKGTSNTYGSDAFKNGEVLFSIGSSGGSGYQSSPQFEVGVCPVPSYNSNQLYVTQGPTIAILNNLKLSAAKDEEATLYAWKFLKYLTSTDVDVEMCLSSEGYIPVRKSSYTNEGYVEYLEKTDLAAKASSAVIEYVNGKYFNSPVFRGSATARVSVGGIITDVFLGKKSIDDAFDAAYNVTVASM